MINIKKLGVILIILSLASFAYQLNFMANAKKTVGTVTSLHSVGKSNLVRAGTTVNSVVNYKTVGFYVNNQYITCDGSMLSALLYSSSSNIGDRIFVLYNSKKPDMAYIDNAMDVWITPLFLFFFGLIFSIIIPYCMYIIESLTPKIRM